MATGGLTSIKNGVEKLVVATNTVRDVPVSPQKDPVVLLKNSETFSHCRHWLARAKHAL